MPRKDFGDRATGRLVNEHDEFRLTKPARTVTGTVVGVFPYAPKVVTVLTADNERLVIRIAA